MGVAAQRSTPPSDRVVCPSCGTEQERPETAQATCAICSKPLTQVSLAAAPETRPEPRLESSPVLRAVKPASSDSTRQAISEIVSRGPQNEAPRLVSELLKARKSLASILSLIPLIGPRLLRESDLHTNREKSILAWLSMLLTALAALGIVLLIPSPAQRIDAMSLRIESEMGSLSEFAERYRSQKGAYPTPQTLKRFADRADPRFYDPWGRPYRFEPKADGFTLSTLGRDGTPGGKSEDADIERHFSSAASPG